MHNNKKPLKLTIKQQINRIEKIYIKSTREEKTEGINWYRDARKFAEKTANKYGLRIDQVCQLISLLSPQKKWEQNKIDVISIIEDTNVESIFSTQRTLDECRLVIEDKFRIPESRTKTFNFAKCIELDGQCNSVVIDRHAIKIAFGQMSASEIGITAKRYSDAAKAYNELGERYNMTGAQMQAITWVTYKRIVNR